MPTVEEKIALAREERDKADEAFREALRKGREAGLSWPQLATMAGLTKNGARYLAENLNRRRQRPRETANA